MYYVKKVLKNLVKNYTEFIWWDISHALVVAFWLVCILNIVIGSMFLQFCSSSWKHLCFGCWSTWWAWVPGVAVLSWDHTSLCLSQHSLLSWPALAALQMTSGLEAAPCFFWVILKEHSSIYGFCCPTHGSFSLYK